MHIDVATGNLPNSVTCLHVSRETTDVTIQFSASSEDFIVEHSFHDNFLSYVTTIKSNHTVVHIRGHLRPLHLRGSFHSIFFQLASADANIYQIQSHHENLVHISAMNKWRNMTIPKSLEEIQIQSNAHENSFHVAASSLDNVALMIYKSSNESSIVTKDNIRILRDGGELRAHSTFFASNMLSCGSNICTGDVTITGNLDCTTTDDFSLEVTDADVSFQSGATGFIRATQISIISNSYDRVGIDISNFELVAVSGPILLSATPAFNSVADGVGILIRQDALIQGLSVTLNGTGNSYGVHVRGVLDAQILSLVGTSTETGVYIEETPGFTADIVGIDAQGHISAVVIESTSLELDTAIIFATCGKFVCDNAIVKIEEADIRAKNVSILSTGTSEECAVLLQSVTWTDAISSSLAINTGINQTPAIIDVQNGGSNSIVIQSCIIHSDMLVTGNFTQGFSFGVSILDSNVSAPLIQMDSDMVAGPASEEALVIKNSHISAPQTVEFFLSMAGRRFTLIESPPVRYLSSVLVARSRLIGDRIVINGNTACNFLFSASVTPSITATSSVTASISLSPTKSRSPSPSSSASPSISTTTTRTRTESASRTSSSSPTPSTSPSTSISETRSPSRTASSSSTYTGSPTLSIPPTHTVSASMSHTKTRTISDSPTDTPTCTSSNTPTASNTPTRTNSDTPSSSSTNTRSDTPSDTPSSSVSHSSTNTRSDTISTTPTNTRSETPSNTPSSSSTNTISDTPSDTPSGSVSHSSTNTRTTTPSESLTPSRTFSVSVSVSGTSSVPSSHSASVTSSTSHSSTNSISLPPSNSTTTIVDVGMRKGHTNVPDDDLFQEGKSAEALKKYNSLHDILYSSSTKKDTGPTIHDNVSNYNISIANAGDSAVCTGIIIEDSEIISSLATVTGVVTGNGPTIGAIVAASSFQDSKVGGNEIIQGSASSNKSSAFGIVLLGHSYFYGDSKSITDVSFLGEGQTGDIWMHDSTFSINNVSHAVFGQRFLRAPSIILVDGIATITDQSESSHIMFNGAIEQYNTQGSLVLSPSSYSATFANSVDLDMCSILNIGQTNMIAPVNTENRFNTLFVASTTNLNIGGSLFALEQFTIASTTTIHGDTLLHGTAQGVLGGSIDSAGDPMDILTIETVETVIVQCSIGADSPLSELYVHSPLTFRSVDQSNSFFFIQTTGTQLYDTLSPEGLTFQTNAEFKGEELRFATTLSERVLTVSPVVHVNGQTTFPAGFEHQISQCEITGFAVADGSFESGTIIVHENSKLLGSGLAKNVHCRENNSTFHTECFTVLENLFFTVNGLYDISLNGAEPCDEYTQTVVGCLFKLDSLESLQVSSTFTDIPEGFEFVIVRNADSVSGAIGIGARLISVQGTTMTVFVYETDVILRRDPIPFGVPDFYQITEAPLVIPAERGLLANDYGPADSFGLRVIAVEPYSEFLNWNSNGSFTYFPTTLAPLEYRYTIFNGFDTSEERIRLSFGLAPSLTPSPSHSAEPSSTASLSESLSSTPSISQTSSQSSSLSISSTSSHSAQSSSSVSLSKSASSSRSSSSSVSESISQTAVPSLSALLSFSISPSDSLSISTSVEDITPSSSIQLLSSSPSTSPTSSKSESETSSNSISLSATHTPAQSPVLVAPLVSLTSSATLTAGTSSSSAASASITPTQTLLLRSVAAGCSNCDVTTLDVDLDTDNSRNIELVNTNGNTEGLIFVPSALVGNLEVIVATSSQSNIVGDTIVDINLFNEFGESVTTLDSPIEICLFYNGNENTEDLCLGYYEESTEKWICEDECLQNEDDTLCGESPHLTSFALLLSGGNGRNRDNDPCGTDSFQFLYSWLSLAFVGCALCCILFAIIVIELFFLQGYKKKNRALTITVHDQQ